MMNGNDNTQGTLAKLLAKENIRIQHGNYSTAFFDVKNRILGLPNWKNKGKDVYDLLCGHEVGHALYTPRDAFDSNLDCHKGLLNIVEDARIERMVQESYPGLISCFRRAYSQLHTENFFGVNGRDLNTLGFADRINLKFKLGSLVSIAFSSKEQDIVDQIAAAQTWDDVVRVTRLLQKHLQEEQKQEQQKQEAEKAAAQQQEEGEQSSPESSTKSESQESEKSESDGSAEDDSSEESDESSSNDSAKSDAADQAGEKTESESNADSKESADETSNKSEMVSNDGEFDPTANAEPTEGIKIETVDAAEDNAEKLLDMSLDVLQTLEVEAPTVAEIKEVLIDFAKVDANRQQSSRFMECVKFEPIRQDYAKFMQHTKKIVANYVKEFELRKAAYQYSRATVAKTGSLNVNRLHAYKTSDDIFLSVTKLADSKNHAMLMFVDYSGSMQSVLSAVLKQTINLSLFCRSLGIPFKVYGFTSDNHFTAEGRTPYYPKDEDVPYNKLLISNLNLLELASSEMDRADFDKAMLGLYLRATHFVHGSAEALGNTPLNETIIVAHKLVADFKAKYNPDRMISIFLTDGQGHHPKAVMSKESKGNLHEEGAKRGEWGFANLQFKLKFKLNGRYVKASYGTMTPSLIKNLRETTNSEVIGFFIPPHNSKSEYAVRNHFVSAVSSVKGVGSQGANEKWEKHAKKEYSTNNVIRIENAFNYSNYFIVANPENIDVDDEESVDITSDMTRGQMARKFMKFSNSKKTNRVFVTKFVEALA